MNTVPFYHVFFSYLHVFSLYLVFKYIQALQIADLALHFTNCQLFTLAQAWQQPSEVNVKSEKRGEKKSMKKGK